MAKVAVKRTAPAPVDQIETFDVTQRSEEWYALRLGLMTASNFSIIRASGKDGGASIGRRTLQYRLAGEILTEKPAETYRNDAMDRGNEMELDAVQWYASQTFEPITRVGFVKRTVAPHGLGQPFVIGCSPDALVGDDGMVQVKTTKPELLIKHWNEGCRGYPPEHMAQQQGEMWVTGRKWSDLVIFYRGMPVTLKFRIPRDEAYIAALAIECERFDWELRALIKKLRETPI